MDLLIKGMYMPKGDEILRLEILPNGQVNRIIGWAISEKRDAKAIELPPHGRLIHTFGRHTRAIEFNDDEKLILQSDALLVVQGYIDGYSYDPSIKKMLEQLKDDIESIYTW